MKGMWNWRTPSLTFATIEIHDLSELNPLGGSNRLIFQFWPLQFRTDLNPWLVIQLWGSCQVLWEKIADIPTMRATINNLFDDCVKIPVQQFSGDLSVCLQRTRPTKNRQFIEGKRALTTSKSGYFLSNTTQFCFFMQAPLQHTIELSLDFYDIENSSQCAQDSLVVIDRYQPQNNRSTFPLHKMCGQFNAEDSQPWNYTSHLHHLEVTFISDDVDSASAGYVLHYKVVPGEWPSAWDVLSSTKILTMFSVQERTIFLSPHTAPRVFPFLHF